MALVTSAPEWYGLSNLDFLNFLAVKARNISAPLRIVDICRDFKKVTKSSRSIASLATRICQIRENFHKIDELDTETKVKMMFVYRAPVDREFIVFLRKDAVLEVDDKNRIIKYQNNQGLQLCGFNNRGQYSSAKSKRSLEKSNEESDDEPDEHEDGETKEEEEYSIIQTSSGRIARKRTFFNYDEFLIPPKVPKKTDVKLENVSISKNPSSTTGKQGTASSQKSPERNKTKKSVRFAEKVTAFSYHDDWDSSSDDISPDEAEAIDMFDPAEEDDNGHKAKKVKFDPIVTVFPIPRRDAIISFEINKNESSCPETNHSQQSKKSVRFSQNVSIHSYECFSDSSSDSGVDDFDEHENSLDGFEEIIDFELNRLQVRDVEKEQEKLKPAEPVNGAFDMMSPKEFMKIFENMAKTFNLLILDDTQFGLQEEIALMELDDQKTLTNMFDDFLSALKMVPNEVRNVLPKAEMTTRNAIFLVLRAIMITLNSPSLEVVNMKLTEIMNEFQESDLIVPIEALRVSLKSLLQSVQAVCIAKSV